MNKLTSLIRRAPKRLSAIVAIVAAAVIIPAAVNAWGPVRDTYTIEQPANKVTFNSITNNPNIGDERNFVGIREAGSANTWYDDVNAQEGKEYIVRMYVHNNAADNLNLVAENVTAKFNLPTTTGKSIQVNGFVNSSNATPTEVYDHATFNSDKDFNLAYVAGSLKYENNVFGPNGTPLSESIFTSAGTKLGYDKLDGRIPGCFEYAGYVTFKVKPQFAPTTNFTLTKEVSKHGENKWTEEYKAQPGEVVDFLMVYKNTGEVNHNDVTFRDTLPAGLSYAANSGSWSNASTQNNKFTNDLALTNGTGINIGAYAPGSNAYTIFSAKVSEAKDLACGTNKLVNKGKVNTGGYAVEDTATVIVDKECQPSKIKVCELATKKIISINESDFDSSKHSKNLADCKEEVKKIKVCELSSKQIITINEKDFDSSKHTKDLSKCKETPPSKIKVCELTSKTIITINESDFDATKHSKDLSVCAQTPVTPPELPKTGAGENIVALFGLGTLIASIAYYAASRRALNQ